MFWGPYTSIQVSLDYTALDLGSNAGVVPAGEDLIADIQEEAALAVEMQLQDAEELVAGVQEEVALVIEMQLDRILCKAPHSRSPLERLAVNQWAEHQAQL